MRDRQFDQVHDLPEGYADETYTYDGLVNVEYTARLAIYMLTFATAFTVFSHLFRLI